LEAEKNLTTHAQWFTWKWALIGQSVQISAEPEAENNDEWVRTEIGFLQKLPWHKSPIQSSNPAKLRSHQKRVEVAIHLRHQLALLEAPIVNESKVFGTTREDWFTGQIAESSLEWGESSCFALRFEPKVLNCPPSKAGVL